ncbi:hypothetical protein C8R45DRAFT_1110638 [Mycena sanguinolenta]|nr:hypothetical protein C8R45DRAFT_1110638 [Mycena sanguinolenta]
MRRVGQGAAGITGSLGLESAHTGSWVQSRSGTQAKANKKQCKSSTHKTKPLHAARRNVWAEGGGQFVGGSSLAAFPYFIDETHAVRLQSSSDVVGVWACGPPNQYRVPCTPGCDLAGAFARRATRTLPTSAAQDMSEPHTVYPLLLPTPGPVDDSCSRPRPPPRPAQRDAMATLDYLLDCRWQRTVHGTVYLRPPPLPTRLSVVQGCEPHIVVVRALRNLQAHELHIT